MKRLTVQLFAVAFLVIWSMGISQVMSSDRVDLRSQPKQLSASDLKQILNRHHFFDQTKNPRGDFANDLVDNGDGTVTDRSTGLMWQKAGSRDGVLWKNAQDYLTQLNKEHFAGHTDWRLPTIEELASLMEPARSADHLHIDPVFSNEQDICWSSDTFGKNTAWYASFRAGMIRHIYDFYYYVRAVRTLK
jgi:hypothetical protein